MDRFAHRAPLTLALAVAALCCAAPSALAATVGFTPRLGEGESPPVIGHQMAYLAAPGEVNAVSVTESAGAVTIRDAALALAAPAGCQQLDPRAVTCPPSAGPLKVAVALTDGNDSASLSTSIDGVNVDGGSGNDVLVGGAGDDILDGETGNDLLVGAAGNDLLEPGLGSDVLAGGEGSDSAVYTARGLPVSLDLAMARADGATDPADALSSIEGAISGDGEDALTGDGGPNRLDSGIGADRLTGGDGSDELIGGEGSDQIDAGGGDDDVDLSVFESEAESVDVLNRAADQRADRVRCGSGRDRVVLPDVLDSLASDCELVLFDFIAVRQSGMRVTRRHLLVRVAAVVAGSRQRIWLTIKRGGHTSLLGRSEPRRRAGTARIRLNSNGLRLFRDGRKHRIRIGDELDPDTGFIVKVGR